MSELTDSQKNFVPPDNGPAQILCPLPILRNKISEEDKRSGVNLSGEIEIALEDLDTYEYLLRAIVANRRLAFEITLATCERYDFCLISKRELGVLTRRVVQ